MTMPPLPDTDWSFDATWQYTDAQIRTYAEQAVAAERARCLREIKSLHWTPRVQGRWDKTDVAHAEGFNMAKTKALLVLGPNARLTGPQRPAQE